MNSDVTLNHRYDRIMYDRVFLDYFANSDFANFGYWTETTTNPKEAGENLVEKLLEFVPNKTGKILDVACGKGETTRYLTRYYPPQDITGINISEKQLASCRHNVPQATFKLMDAVNLEFASEFFDCVICVEAAFHFNTREQFLREAYRVLKPGGTIVLSDILKTPAAGWKPEELPYKKDHMEQNYVEHISDYETIFQQVGFVRTNIVDATEHCWKSYFRYLVQFLHEKFLNHQIDETTLKQYLEPNYIRVGKIQNYLLVAAQK
jgi:ubiquinone/menaquinone biosynthesis C-methylase UbiE